DACCVLSCDAALSDCTEALSGSTEESAAASRLRSRPPRVRRLRRGVRGSAASPDSAPASVNAGLVSSPREGVPSSPYRDLERRDRPAGERCLERVLPG